MRNIDK